MDEEQELRVSLPKKLMKQFELARIRADLNRRDATAQALQDWMRKRRGANGDEA